MVTTRCDADHDLGDCDTTEPEAFSASDGAVPSRFDVDPEVVAVGVEELGL